MNSYDGFKLHEIGAAVMVAPLLKGAAAPLRYEDHLTLEGEEPQPESGESPSRASIPRNSPLAEANSILVTSLSCLGYPMNKPVVVFSLLWLLKSRTSMQK
ncbi:hypothetical protein QOT17_023886 [Balamuthia mandrillaris]